MSPGQPLDSPDHEVFDAALRDAAAAIGLDVAPPRRQRMYAHFRRVVEANQQFNLTRITSPADAAVKHYADSLTLLACPWVDARRPVRLLDVGTGAGFPAIPLAIMCEGWAITAIDGTGKKARFVAAAAAALGLENVHACHARAADLARSGSCAGPGCAAAAERCCEPFDLVVLRAVSRIAVGLKEVRPLIRPGGAVVFYKTAEIKREEVAGGRRTARALGLREGEPFFVTLPSPEGPIRRRLIRYGA